MSNKTALITGGNAGIGFAVAEKLLKWDQTIQLCLACRNKSKAEKARSDLLNKFPSADISIVITDTSKLASVYNAAKEIKKRYNHLDYLYLNAGIMPVSKVDWSDFWSGIFSSKCFHMLSTGEGLLNQTDGMTSDGLKEIFATNLFGHFVMVKHLEDRLGGPDRTTQIIWTSSSNAKREFFDMADIQHRNGWQPYSSSKYASDLTSVAINERLNKQGVYSHATCPGMVMTNLTYGILPSWVWILLFPIVCLLRLAVPSMTYSVESGAESLFWLATQPPQKLDPMSKYHSCVPFIGKTYTKPSKMDVDTADAIELFSTLNKMEETFDKELNKTENNKL